jgi:hypothetical protein
MMRAPTGFKETGYRTRTWLNDGIDELVDACRRLVEKLRSVGAHHLYLNSASADCFLKMFF